MPYFLRPARATDAPFLIEMLIAAAFWRADGPVGTVQEVMSNPELAHYVEGWPRTGDRGVVAEDERPIGAAWMRYFSEDDPGFGFVDAAVPEVGMGVVKDWRGRGVGERLLAALVDVARQQRVEAVSLSVEADNYARRLYERAGFRTVGTVGGSFTIHDDLLASTRTGTPAPEWHLIARLHHCDVLAYHPAMQHASESSPATNRT